MSQFTNPRLKSGMNIMSLGYTKLLYGRCSNEVLSGVVVGDGTVAVEIRPGGYSSRPLFTRQPTDASKANSLGCRWNHCITLIWPNTLADLILTSLAYF
jgi:hypothetical protein